MELVFGIVAFQEGACADVLAVLRRLHDKFAQDIGTFQAEVEAVGGYGVHADCGIADKGGAGGAEAAGMHAHQRVGMQGAGFFHFAEFVFQLFFQIGGQFFGRHGKQRARFVAVYGDDAVGQVLFQRQQGEGAAVLEKFDGGVAVGYFVFEAADDDGAAEVVHVGRNADLAAGLRKTAVCRHQQAGGQFFAVIQCNIRTVGIGAGFFHAHACQQGNIVLLGHCVVSGFADVVVGNQVAQAVGRTAARLCRLREMELVGRGAVPNFRIAERVNFVFGYTLPHAQAFHNLFREVGQGDFAAVVGWVGNAFERAFFHYGNPQAAVGQGACETQSRRPCADDDNIRMPVHLHCSSIK